MVSSARKYPSLRCEGRFFGRRVNCEGVPALPAWAVRWCLDDPRRVPYLLVWKSLDGEVKEAVRVTHCSDPGPFYGSSREFFHSPSRGVLRCKWVEIKRPSEITNVAQAEVFVRTIEQPLPRRGGRALLLVCPECRNACRVLYGWEPGGRFTHSAQIAQWKCRTCAGLRYASEGGAFCHSDRPEPWYPYVFSSLDAAADLPRPRLVAIDIPIGLADSGPRACDIAARKLLGKPRGDSVFPAPVRATLAAKTYEEACELSRQAIGKALSKQTFELLAKIREVDELITPELQTWMFEIHPEVSFWALNGRQPLKHKKSTREGREGRLKLLRPHYPEIERHLAQLDRAKAAEHDLLDAAVAAWTAECVAKGIVPRQYDKRGLRMEMVH